MSTTVLTKKDIIHHWHTSIIPPCGTEELNKFCLDIATRFTAWTVVNGESFATGHRKIWGQTYYINRNRAIKAYAKYGFTDEEITQKLEKPHPNNKANRMRSRFERYLKNKQS